jgi:hypothetical protein
MDRYVTVGQGSVFYITEALAQMEGLERGPAGNTSLAVAFCLAQEMDQDQVIVVQETEYTGAGKHINPQLTFAKENGIELIVGNPKDEKPGVNIVLPEHLGMLFIKDMDLDKLRRSSIKNQTVGKGMNQILPEDVDYLMLETKASRDFVMNHLAELAVTVEGK